MLDNYRVIPSREERLGIRQEKKKTRRADQINNIRREKGEKANPRSALNTTELRPIPKKVLGPQPKPISPAIRGMRVNIDPKDYPITYISLDQLFYRWNAPQFIKNKNNETILKRFYDNEKYMVASEQDGKRGAETRMRAVYNSMKDVGMVNPLIVKQEHYDSSFNGRTGSYFVVIGNQRLACLRAFDLRGEVDFSKIVGNNDRKIACLVSRSDDNWSDNTEAFKALGYAHIEGYPHNRTK